MPSRELIYRVAIKTNDARRAAANVRATFERELRTISLGKIDTSSITQAAVAANRVSQNASNIRPPAVAPTALPPAASGGIGGFFTGRVDAALKELKGLAAGYLGIQGVISGITEAIDLTRLNTQVQRANASFDILSGGAEKAAVNVSAIQTAAGGAVTSLNAIAIGNQAASLGLAKTTEGFAELARSARLITMVSPIIKEQGEALTQLALFASNVQSYARADQLGLSASEVRDRLRQLRQEFSDLDDAQLKLLASTQLLDEKFGPLLNTVEAQASGLERLTANYNEFRIAIAAGTGPVVDKIAETLASVFSQATVNIAGTDTPLQTLINNLKETERISRALEGLNPVKKLLPDGAFGIDADTIAQEIIAEVGQGIDSIPLIGPLIPETVLGGLDAGTILGDPDQIKQITTALEVAAAAVSAGVPGANEFFNEVKAVAVAVDQTNFATAEQAALVGRLTAAYQEQAQAGGEAFAQQQQQAQAAKQLEEQRLARIFEQQEAVNQALASRAQKVAPTVGIDQAIALYREQKLAAEQAIDQMAATGVSDANEVAIRTADIVTQLLAPFDELEAKASAIDLGATIGNFDQVGTALAGLNAGFVDFLPGLSAAREELVTLSTEMALTGQITDEQAARLEYLAAVAYSAADGGSALSQVVGDLGTDFLESNSYAAELVNQLFLAEAAYASGAITGDIYAGITTILTGRLLTLAQGAGIATGAIYALNQAQAGLASAGGLAVGGNIANRIQSTQQTIAREQNRREQERYNRDLARSQERSAGRAGKLLEDGAKKASQELKSALDKVPGLFSASQVTEQDMKDTELGVYQEKADEYLRRLRDEVQNGRDWEDVSIEEARAGLERAGLQIGETAEQTLMFLERAINDSSLYSAVENIPIFINEEAVKLTQELQNKSEEGRKNIYEYFGIQVDEAVGAATGGGGGGGVAIEVRPPEFIDIDPYTEGLQTGLDEYVNTNGELIKEKMANAPSLIFDPAMLFDPESLVVAAQKKTEAAAAQYKAALDTAGLPMGPMAKPTVTVTADASAQAWGPVVAGTQPAQIALAPTIDTAELQAQLDAITAPTLTATIVLPNDAANQLVLDLGNQLGQQANILISHGVVIGRALISGMTSTLSADTSIATSIQPQLDAIKSPSLTATISLPNDAGEQLALDIGNQLGQQANVLISHGAVVGKALISGMSAALSVDSEGNAQIDFAGFVANNLGAQAQTFIAQGRGVASLLRQGITEGMAPAESETATGGFAVQIASITVADGVRAPDVSVLGKIDKFAIDQTALYDADLSIAPTIDLTTASEERQKLERALTFSIKPALFISDEVKQTFATDLETTMPPVAIHPNIFAGTTQISDFYVDLQDNLVSPPVQPILAITVEEIQRFNTLIGAAVHPVVEVGLSIPQQQTNTDGSAGANAITPLITDINTQIRSGQEEIKNQGITIAMILMAGIAAHFQGGQSSGGEQAATPLADALITSMSTQFSATQNMFYAIGLGPAQSVESGFKGYGYSGLSSGLMDALTNGIRADAENYMQRGATIAGYVQSGMNQQFSAEAGVRSAIAAGAAWGNAFMQGVFEALNGAGFVDQISTQVIDGITGELEQP